MPPALKRTLALAATAALAASLLAAAPGALAGEAKTYVVLYREKASTADAKGAVERAGGTLVANYREIGVVIARSANPSFGTAIRGATGVQGAGSTEQLGAKVDGELVEGPPPGDQPNGTADPTGETFWNRQWDMAQINLAQAHAVTAGSRSVLVGDLDTGLDYQHPDLAPNIDFGASASCESGAPVQDPAAWDDHQGHGTHTAGTIAAAANGLGVVGVAPNVRIAAIKTSNDDGFFYPHMIVCAFMWAAARGVDVTNNSYFADPYLYNCANDPGERAIRLAEVRAIRYAQSKGVIVVSSAGNSNLDMAHTTTDPITPSDGVPLNRDVTNACIKIPAEVPGVVTVTATGDLSQKAYYSDYGIGVVDVAAPGGDRRFQVTQAAPNGRVLSTYILEQPTSSLVLEDCTGGVCGKYAYLQGTSMAGPHATGVLALIESRYGPISSGSAISILEQSANPIACPSGTFDPGGNGAFAATCQGGASYNGFYGHGEIDAYAAVTR